MTHDKDCFLPERMDWPCICDRLRKAYREGYSDHARAQQHWQDTHGAYRQEWGVGHCPQCRDRVDMHYLDDSRIWRCRYCPCDMQFTTMGLNP